MQRHPIEFDIEIPAGGLPTQSCYLAVRAHDVDWTRGEYDKLYLNGEALGRLSGLDAQWNTTYYAVPLHLIHEGYDTVKVELYHEDAGGKIGPGTWGVTVDWGQLVCDGGSQQNIKNFDIRLTNTAVTSKGIEIYAEITTDTVQPAVYSTEFTVTDSKSRIVGSGQGAALPVM